MIIDLTKLNTAQLNYIHGVIGHFINVKTDGSHEKPISEIDVPKEAIIGEKNE
ncbi:protein of unknown function [Oenococcus oeni]|uniref:hypothetical protein n=1 Tax=Oenococcus oeni TaxID=1247 RepID=UPI0010AFE016|nr:hypothetical protein [Oenococcus oeni]SYV99717.1 hypothetical protein OENI_20100 [Oenococcus oeni]SYW03895.1 hypothetical protein OENI_90038 [Oenococcus oeni]SYW17671.1 hypothetical protein OENI_10339 [Oenococcus oeni]VDC14604.1 protein of unknown function [Oenococcus oeni]